MTIFRLRERKQFTEKQGEDIHFPLRDSVYLRTIN